MQRPAELVSIPESLRKASESFGKLRKVAAFWKNPEKIWSKFSKTQQHAGKIWAWYQNEGEVLKVGGLPEVFLDVIQFFTRPMPSTVWPFS